MIRAVAFAVFAFAVAIGAGVDAQAGEVDPLALAARLALLGERVPGGEAHREAAAILRDHLAALGLAPVRAAGGTGGVANVEALLPGRDPAAGEIVLAAHYDTVPGSPGAADDASGCAVVVAAVEELERLPLRRALRVVLFDGEEAGLLGSRAWAAALGQEARGRILAAVHLDVVGLDREGAPVVLDLAGSPLRSGAARAPAWLVHAVLRAGSAVDFAPRVADHRRPLQAQLLTRTARAPWSSDAAAVLAAGIPAVLLTDYSVLHPYDAMHAPEDAIERLDGERLARWVAATAAVVRRIDALEGRPAWEEEFLALGGRVFIRRDLLWIGLALWVVLVFRGRPGRWAGAPTAERRERGRVYLPGYAFRLAFLAAAVWIPAVAAPLLYPLAPLALLGPRTTRGRAAVGAAAAAPLLLWLVGLALAARDGLIGGLALTPAQAVLLASTVGAFGWQLWSGPAPPLRGGA